MPQLSATFGIKALGVIGGMAVLYVLLSASMTPRMGQEQGQTLDQRAAAIPGITMSYPPRPVPDTVSGLIRPTTSPSGPFVVAYAPARCTSCESEIDRFGALLDQSELDRFTIAVGHANENGLSDEIGMLDDYIGRNRRDPVFIFYNEGREIGRFEDVPEESAELKLFLNRLAAQKGAD